MNQMFCSIQLDSCLYFQKSIIYGVYCLLIDTIITSSIQLVTSSVGIFRKLFIISVSACSQFVLHYSIYFLQKTGDD